MSRLTSGDRLNREWRGRTQINPSAKASRTADNLGQASRLFAFPFETVSGHANRTVCAIRAMNWSPKDRWDACPTLKPSDSMPDRLHLIPPRRRTAFPFHRRCGPPCGRKTRTTGRRTDKVCHRFGRPFLSNDSHLEMTLNDSYAPRRFSSSISAGMAWVSRQTIWTGRSLWKLTRVAGPR